MRNGCGLCCPHHIFISTLLLETAVINVVTTNGKRVNNNHSSVGKRCWDSAAIAPFAQQWSRDPAENFQLWVRSFQVVFISVC